MDTIKHTSQYGIELLTEAQQGNIMAEEQLLTLVRDQFMNKRIWRYLNRNRQVEREDLKQEFMIGVALNIHKARLDIGDPFEYILQQGIFRVKTYLRRSIIQNTIQVCLDCGNVSRLNSINNNYICKKCGSKHISTHELTENNDILLDNMMDNVSLEDEVLSNMMLELFEMSLTPNTNVYNIYFELKSGVRDNSEINNYVKHIADKWCTTQQNVMQNVKKLRIKLQKFAEENGCIIVDNTFYIK